MFIFSLTAAILGICSFILAGIIFLSKHDDQKGRYLSYAIFFFGLWLLGNTKVDIASSIEEVILYNAVLTLGISFYVTFFVLFVDSYLSPNKPISIIRKGYYFGLSIFFVLISPTTFAFSEITIYPNKPVEELLGPMWLIFFIFYITAHVSVFRKLIKDIQSASERRKNQSKYILLGSMLAFCGALFFDLVLPTFGELRFYNLGPQFSVFFIGCTSYAILRHKLLDIKIIIQRSLIYTFLVACVTLLYIAILITASKPLGHIGTTDLSILTALLTALIGIFTVPSLEQLLQRATDTILYKGSYNYSSSLRILSEILNRHIEATDIVTKISHELKKILRIQEVFIYLPHQRQILNSSGIIMHADEYPTDSLLQTWMDEEEIIYCDEMKHIRQQKTNLTQEDMDMLHKLQIFCRTHHIAIGVPLQSEKQIMGMVLLSSKRSGETFTHQDKQLLVTFGHQLALALEKARLYEQVKKHSIELEDKIRERTEKIMDLQQRQSQMLLDISHGLQTPLTVMKGEIEQMPEIKTESIKPFGQSLDMLSQYITNMLTLAKMESYIGEEKELIPISHIVDEIVEYFTVIANQQRIAVNSHVEKDLYVYGNKSQLEELVRNLLSNAIKYIDNEKIITVTLKEQDNEHIWLHVTDTGIGISKEDIPHLFKRFYRVTNRKKKIKGTGLGLAICDRIVKNHNGTIEVNSVLHKGTSIIVRLPIASSTENTSQ